MSGLTLAGVHTVLRRARIVWNRARASIRSPDPDYDAQLAAVAAAVEAAQAQPGRVIAVYLDEVTVERQPTVAHAYAPTGSSEQARAVRSPKSNPVTRLIGALNVLTGRVFHRRAGKITVGFLVAFIAVTDPNRAATHVCLVVHNPIEKPWRKLRQDVTHLHRWADDLEALRTGIDRFLDQFAKGSLELLRYVGLAVPD